MNFSLSHKKISEYEIFLSPKNVGVLGIKSELDTAISYGLLHSKLLLHLLILGYKFS